MTLTSAVDTYAVAKILLILQAKWTSLPAYKLGIIDAKGNPLKKSWELKTAQEKNAYTPLHILVFHLKRLLNGVPNVASKLAAIGIALKLMKEQYDLTDQDIKLIRESVYLNEDGEGGGDGAPPTCTTGSTGITAIAANPPVFPNKKKPLV